MKLQGLTLIVTDDCNFNCEYCYKPKSNDYMEFPLAEKALIFFCLF
jgi:molybdenum cofactor biosynthesis enzyme MoaA